MNIAILFWFYKELETTENHLKILKENNPDVPIYGLFGGGHDEAARYEAALGKYLDNFYASPFKDPEWKWIHGDLMILDWFEKRGGGLAWESIIVVQWDMLVFAPLKDLFAEMRSEQIFLSGLMPLDSLTEKKWQWTNPERQERQEFLRFKEYLKNNYDYEGEMLCCLFILQIFPRIFFEKYATVKEKELGMLEYKIPMYAKIFGIPFFEKDMGVWWFTTPSKRNETPLNAAPEEISATYIKKELARENGFRVFHPYYKKWRPKKWLIF